jgi:hypothetical protein
VDEIVSNVEEVLDVFLSEEEELVEEVTEEEQEEVNSYSIYDDISSYDIRVNFKYYKLFYSKQNTISL